MNLVTTSWIEEDGVMRINKGPHGWESALETAQASHLLQFTSCHGNFIIWSLQL